VFVLFQILILHEVKCTVKRITELTPRGKEHYITFSYLLGIMDL